MRFFCPLCIHAQDKVVPDVFIRNMLITGLASARGFALIAFSSVPGAASQSAPHVQGTSRSGGGVSDVHGSTNPSAALSSGAWVGGGL